MFVMFLGGSFGYEIAGFAFGDKLFSVYLYDASSFAGSMLFILYLFIYLFTYGMSFNPLEFGYRATRVFDSGWIQYFGGKVLYWVLFNLGNVYQWFQYNSLKVFL